MTRSASTAASRSTCRGTFFFAFARARHAVAAAVEAQRAHAEHEWAGGEAVRVRMGLHTGELSVGEEGYLAVDVTRAAAVVPRARAGTSSSRRRRVRCRVVAARRRFRPPARPAPVKDIDEPERIYELQIEGVQAPLTEAQAPPAAKEDWDRRRDALVERMTQRINENVYRSLERALGDLGEGH